MLNFTYEVGKHTLYLSKDDDDRNILIFNNDNPVKDGHRRRLIGDLNRLLRDGPLNFDYALYELYKASLYHIAELTEDTIDRITHEIACEVRILFERFSIIQRYRHAYEDTVVFKPRTKEQIAQSNLDVEFTRQDAIDLMVIATLAKFLYPISVALDNKLEELNIPVDEAEEYSIEPLLSMIILSELNTVGLKVAALTTQTTQGWIDAKGIWFQRHIYNTLEDVDISPATFANLVTGKILQKRLTRFPHSGLEIIPYVLRYTIHDLKERFQAYEEEVHLRNDEATQD